MAGEPWLSRKRVALVLWLTAALGAIVPVAALSVYSIRVTDKSVRKLVRADNLLTADLAAENVRSHLHNGLILARAVGSTPGFVKAVKAHDEEAVRVRLANLVRTDTTIDRAFVLDPKGVLWSDYPVAPESLGKDFSFRDYYRGAAKEWRPYVSEVFKRMASPHVLVVAISAPVKDEEGKIAGVLVFQHRLDKVEWLKRVGASGERSVVLLDHRGIVAGHPTLDLTADSYDGYAGLEPVKQVMKGYTPTVEYTDPVSKKAMVATFAAALLDDGHRWVVISQQERDEAYATVAQLRWQIAIAGGLVAVLGLLAALALARVSNRNRVMSLQLEAKNAQLEDAVSAEREAHEALKRAESQMVQTEKLASLGQMVAGVAHEINNPLAFASNNLAVLQRDAQALRALIELYQKAEGFLGTSEPELAARIRAMSERIDVGYTLENLDELVDKSREGLKRIEQIVQDLRAFARLDQSDLQYADINAGVTSTVNIARGVAKREKVELELKLGALPMVKCYPARINQVVLNLVTNAIDASPEGGVVTIETRRAGEMVEIVVTDRGTGIAANVLPRIFDPFFTTKPQGKGMGLGLSISYGIVKEHGGEIGVETEVGAGTGVVVRLPVKGG